MIATAKITAAVPPVKLSSDDNPWVRLSFQAKYHHHSPAVL